MQRQSKTTSSNDLPLLRDLRQHQGCRRPGLLVIQSGARWKKSLLRLESYLPPKNPLTAATATESGLLDCTILLLEGIRVHTTWPRSGCSCSTVSACVRPTKERLPQSAFSFELPRERLYITDTCGSRGRYVGHNAHAKHQHQHTRTQKIVYSVTEVILPLTLTNILRCTKFATVSRDFRLFINIRVAFLQVC